ncbi:sulfatase-like hydrolase/transferase [Novipirellula artificiosorum]|uniref:Arylsulfatase n=1 Tax=Novipirellula artificiosorum TaxID=2528016 RepID=A0A5C6D9P1_9BACT|nr:sulfatase-like hydrolase/transferase [Novipirellula artificiosorum]TWU32514.1 Arylsulfatase [Novipirellula artificiosorum]
MRTILRSLLLTLCCFAGVAAHAAESSKPNIVFIYADDWGWGDLSCHGHEWLKTPNIDRLASEGTDFQQFNVLNPVCSPSRTAVMTGKFPARFSVHQHFASPTVNRNQNMPDWLDPKPTMLPRLFQQAGYRTGHFGKWHLTNAGVEGAPKPEAYGYDNYAVFNGGTGWGKPEPLHDMAKDTLAFIEANKDQPFFVNVWLHESHTPHVPTPESMAKWKHLDEQKQVYSAVITDGDNAVGLILDALEREGLSDNTIVMFASDNGPEWTHADQQHKKMGAGYGTWASIGQTSGLRGKKRSLYEGGVRSPFIVRWPGHTPAGEMNNTTVFTGVDLLPTLCAAAAVKLPAEYQADGENLLPALQGSSITRTRPIFWEWRGPKPEPDWWPHFAVRDGDWKLLMTEDKMRVELHNLKTDRAEEAGRDLSKSHPEIVARLKKMILDWKATLPTKIDPNCVSPKRDTD